MPEITVLVADTQRLFAQALGMALERYPDLRVIPSYPTSGFAAVQETLETAPDVALIDYWMPDVEGPSAAERILARAPERKVILLAWFHGSREVRRALDAGAVGFLPKNADIEQVVSAIRGAAAGEEIVLGGELMRLTQSLDERYRKNLELSERMQSLTNRELDVLTALSTGRPIEEVAEQLFVSAKTIKTHIGNVLRKTGARSTAEAVAMARECGLFR